MTKIVLILKSSFIHSFDFPNSIHPWITTSPPSPQEAAILINTFPVCCRAAKQVEPPPYALWQFFLFFFFRCIGKCASLFNSVAVWCCCCFVVLFSPPKKGDFICYTSFFGCEESKWSLFFLGKPLVQKTLFQCPTGGTNIQWQMTLPLDNPTSLSITGQQNILSLQSDGCSVIFVNSYCISLLYSHYFVSH